MPSEHARTPNTHVDHVDDVQRNAHAGCPPCAVFRARLQGGAIQDSPAIDALVAHHHAREGHA